MDKEYATAQPTRAEVDAMGEPLVIEFGTNWCGWCRGAQRAIGEALKDHPNVRHIKVEDGPGRPLGRSFRVKLWPTLVFLKDGQEVARIVRPHDAEPIREALDQLAAKQ